MALFGKTIVVLLLLLVVSSGKEKPQKELTDVPLISYCDLIKNAKAYNGKTVRVRGTYRVGFEFAELYCADCLDRDESTWVEFADRLCRGSKKIKSDRTVNVIFTGMIQTGSGYGHFGAYRNQFLVTCIESAKTLVKDSPSPHALPENILARTHCK